MAHFAKINEENIVLSVFTLNNEDMLNSNGVETESVGQQYLETHNNWPAHLWIQTSYNTKNNKHYTETPEREVIESEDQSKAFRGKYAAIGDTWDPQDQMFWSPKPYPSWVKNMTEARWESPIGNPPALTEEQINQNTPVTDGNGIITAESTHYWKYIWNENNQTWDLTNLRS